jgi:hypothetical protein
MRRPFSQPLFLVFVTLLTLLAFVPARAEETYLPLVSGPAPTTVAVLSMSGWWSPATPGTFEVVGEVGNYSPVTVRQVEIEIVLRDADGAQLGKETAYAFLHRLPTGVKSPFAAHFSGLSGTVYSMEARYSWYETSEPVAQLEIVSQGGAWVVGDYFEVNGTARNPTGAPVDGETAVTAYDAAGKVIGVAYDWTTEPEVIPPGQTGGFRALVSSYKGWPDRSRLASYAVVVVDKP